MSTVSLVIDGGIAALSWDRPGSRNAMDSATAADLVTHLAHLQDRDDIGALILFPPGGTFCAGWDLRELQAVAAHEEDRQRAFLASNLVLLDALRDAAPVTIAVIDGPCLGFGAALACCCDLRIASERSTFGFPEAPLGIVPAMAALAVVPVLTEAESTEWLALGRRRSAAAAANAGLVHEVVATDALLSDVERIRSDLAQVPPRVLRETKGLVRALGTARDRSERRRFAVDTAVASLRSAADT